MLVAVSGCGRSFSFWSRNALRHSPSPAGHFVERYFTRSFEKHGFLRGYEMGVDRSVWTFTGETERARVEFTDEGQTQQIHWEFKHGDSWLPLCDRTARRVEY
jgi:hypothetical protein